MENNLETIKKYFYRFLKENGCFSKYFICKKNIVSIENYAPCLWLQDSRIFCTWFTTSEKDVYWWAISILWQFECIVNRFDNKGSINKLIAAVTVYKKHYNIYNGQMNMDTCVDIKIISLLQEKVDNINNNLTKMLCQKRKEF